MNKPKILTGALAGVLLSGPLVAVYFVGDILLGLPLVPYDVFDWVARTLPGPIITFGIDLMVDTLILVGLDVANTAKTAERIMAISQMLGATATLGALLFFVLRRDERARGKVGPGLVAGLALGIPATLTSLEVNRTATAGPVIGAAWILTTAAVWGMAVAWAYGRLISIPHAPRAKAPATEPVSAEQIGRREFLVRVGSASAAITVVGAGLVSLLGSEDDEAVAAISQEAADTLNLEPFTGELPNADDDLVPAPGTRPEYTPLDDHYRIDISTRPPEISAATWRLPFTGMVASPVELSLDDLRNNYEPLDQFVTLSCISNRVGGTLISTTRWTGASLQDVLADVGLEPGATHLEIKSEDGFYETLALDVVEQDRRVMLTYAWDGEPLRVRHGFPLRVYIPNRYGMKQPKWIIGIEAISEWRKGYWVTRGWDPDALAKTTSVVDTAATNELTDDGKVPVGGIAFAGARGISRVEVSVDDGPWTEAQVREPLSGTTWAIWRYDWPFESGRHTFAVRCFDGDGVMQSEAVQGPRPSGASGIHSVSV